VKLSETGAALIKEFEGLELGAYRDSGNVLTIGYGHTGPDVTEDLKITKERADELFSQDVKKFEEGVSRLVRVPLSQNLRALYFVSFASRGEV
jgi:lysozyme